MKVECGCIYSKEYEKLNDISRDGVKLYYKGNIDLLKEDSFGVVGTRNPTEYGTKICKEIAEELAIRNIPIVSGMANGIDAVAHESALNNNSPTIAVLGSGLETKFSIDERDLIERILTSGGLIISEYESNTPKDKNNFKDRNRIIAAISEGVCVIEAAYRSGSSITAGYASLYNKKVFAVPGRIGDKKSVGTNNLIKKGAIIIMSKKDIIKYYPQFSIKKCKTFHQSCENEEWKEVLELFTKEKMNILELEEKYKKESNKLLVILSELEMNGFIKQNLGIEYFKI